MEPCYTYKFDALVYNENAERVRRQFHSEKQQLDTTTTERSTTLNQRKRAKYAKNLPGEMYAFFANYTDAQSAPSFSKFARAKGVTVSDLEAFRSKGAFDKAYRECIKIRRDYLEDRALNKRFDPTFVKFLISEESDCERESELTDNLAIKVEVV